MTHHDILLARILRDCHEDRMAERALSEHLHSLVLLHGARRNQLQRGTSCLARLFYLGRGVERARGGRGSPMRWRSVFRGSGAYPGWMARSDVLERSLGDTHGRARYGCVVPSRPKQRVDFLCQKIAKRYIPHRAASLANVLRLKKSGFKSPKHCTRALHLSRG